MNENKRWIQSFTIVLSVFAFFSMYLFLRRGYYNLYIINKVFGSVAAAVAGITLLIGPLSKRFVYFTRFMGIRRDLGLVAFYLGIAHVIASLAQTNRFSFPTWYLKEWIPILFGFGAIGIWFYMKTISTNEKIKELGAEVWNNRLSIAGKVGFFAIFLHLVVLKYQGWLRWFQGQAKQTPELAHPSYPPASLFVFVIMIGILLYRLINDRIIQRK